MIDAKNFNARLPIPPDDSPLDTLIRVFAVAHLVEKARKQREEAEQQMGLVEKTQIEEAIVS